MNIVAYCRVSTDKTDQLNSLEKRVLLRIHQTHWCETQTQVTSGIKKIVISDTDFLSSFLWRKQFGIVIKVFARMVV